MEFTEFHPLFSQIMHENGLARFDNDTIAHRFHTLTERMLEVNQFMNLTAIKDVPSIVLRHYADSLTIEPLLPQGATLADVGCGAGFPTLPLAICRPDLKILAIDSTEKRIRYVAQTAALLDCTGVKTIAMRAEDAAAKGYRERFDVCTARAVAALPALSELCLPLVRVGGKFIAMKAKRGEEEWDSAARGIAKLGGKLIARHTAVLISGEEQDERLIFEIQKHAPTPQQYPRTWAKILKSPL